MTVFPRAAVTLLLLVAAASSREQRFNFKSARAAALNAGVALVRAGLERR